jgi:hypothetical protein
MLPCSFLRSKPQASINETQIETRLFSLLYGGIIHGLHVGSLSGLPPRSNVQTDRVETRASCLCNGSRDK